MNRSDLTRDETEAEVCCAVKRILRSKCRKIAGRRHGKPRVRYRRKAARTRVRRRRHLNVYKARGMPREGEVISGGDAEQTDDLKEASDERPRKPPLGHLRIGQAKNPGPSEIPWSIERPQEGLTYPAPHRPGFRDFYTPGYDPDEVEDEEAAEMEAFQLVVETANTTSWGPLRKRLKTTQAHIMLAQETKIMIGKQAEASAWALRNGWKMVAAPATKGKHGGASGGVAIFARSEMGIRFPVHGAHILEEGRAVAAIVEPPACRPLLAISVYLRDGAGMNEANTDTMNKVGACAQLHSEWQRIIGGDFNVTPQELAAAGHAQRMDARVVAPESRRGTCRTR